MASRASSQAFRSDRNALDLPVAALAGLAVAFAAFTIPADLFSDLVGASGLAEILPAAQPPLGTTARIATAAAGSLTMFGLAFMLLRWLDRFAVQAPARPVAGAGPKLRKRDVHPDAPAVRPISASLELGEPAPPVAVKRTPSPAPPAVEAPSPAAVERASPPEAPIVEPSPPRPASLTELMARLERGLSDRRDSPKPQADAAAAAPQPAVNDDRLQSAIDSLQRLAARDG